MTDRILSAVRGGVLALAVFGFVFLGSCATGTSGGTSPSPRKDSDGIDRPTWLTTYPTNPAYYIGIGGSDTGVRADDREAASARARADLAAQISAQVTAELEAVAEASTESPGKETVKQTIAQSVEQNLRSVETVDTWDSPTEGSWVYVRLSKEVWADIVDKEKIELVQRVEGILGDLGDMTEAEALAALGRSYDILAESPWAFAVTSPVLGSSGALIDGVVSEIAARLGSLSFESEFDPPRTKPGVPGRLAGRVIPGGGRKAGAFPLNVRSSTGDTTSLTTDADGNFTVTVITDSLAPGTIRFVVEASLDALGIPGETYAVATTEPELTVEALLLALTVDTTAAPSLSVLEGAVRDWVASLDLPVRIVPAGRGDIDMVFSWTVSDFPRSDRIKNAPYITRVGAVVSVARDGQEITAVETEGYKDGGLDWDQAHERAAQGALEEVRSDTRLMNEIAASFGR